MPIVSKKLLMDEVFYFKKPLTLCKEASPFLFVGDIDMDDHVSESVDSVGQQVFSSDVAAADEEILNTSATQPTSSTPASRRNASKVKHQLFYSLIGSLVF